MMLNARIDYAAGLRATALVWWLLGAFLCFVAVPSCIVGDPLFLGIPGLPVAAIVLLTGSYAAWRFRPRKLSRQ